MHYFLLSARDCVYSGERSISTGSVMWWESYCSVEKLFMYEMTSGVTKLML